MIESRQSRIMIAIILVMLLKFDVVMAQFEFQFKGFSQKDGLSSNNCVKINKDAKGFYWISTDNGLNRFDGNSFYIFKNDPNNIHSLSHNNCNEILIDSKDRCWVNTGNGLSLYNEQNQNFSNYCPDTSVLKGSGPYFFEMAEDNLGKIWLGSFYDMLIFDPISQKFTKSGWYDFAKKSGIIKTELRRNAVLSVKKKSLDELWFLSVYGLFSVNTNTLKFEYYPNNEIQDYWGCTIACIDKNNHLWISTYDQCFYTFNTLSSKWNHFSCPQVDSRFATRINDIKVYSGDTMIMMSDQKILFFDSKKSEFIYTLRNDPDYSKSLPRGLNKKIFVDGNDFLITQTGSTPFVWMKKKPAIVTRDKVVFNKNITSARLSKLKSVESFIYGDWRIGKIFISNTLTQSNTVLKDESGNTQLGAFQKYFYLGQGNSLLSTSHDIYLLDERSNSLNKLILPREIERSKDVEFRNFVRDKHGNIFVRERRRGIFKLSKDLGAINYFDTKIVGNTGEFGALHYDSKTNSLWIAADDNGIFVVNLTKNQTTPYPLISLSTKRKASIADIQGDEKGNVYLTEPGKGIIYIESPLMRIKRYSTFDGLLSNNVRFGILDLKGNYWVTSDKGICKFDLAALRFYTFEDDPFTEFFVDQLFLDNQGNICHADYPNNYLKMSPIQLSSNELGGKIYLKEFLLFLHPLKKDSNYIFYNDQNNITLTFGVLNKSAFSQTSLEYNINEADWRSLPENKTLNLTNLSSGHYRIAVRDKNFIKTSKVIEFRIKKVWWESWWSVLGLLVLFVLIGYGIYRNRIQKIRKVENLKNEYNKKISKIEISALRAQMNPHFVFNCLNSINRFILVNETETASEYLTKFSRLIRLILDNSREESISLERELNALKLYIDMESMRFKNSFDYELIVAPDVNTLDVMVPPLLLQPYVENAIWHGLMHMKSRGKIVVRIEQDPSVDLLKIEIEDNGIGREKSAAIKSKNTENKKSFGIALTNERLILMNSLHGTQTRILIEDVYSSPGVSGGTKVTLLIS